MRALAYLALAILLIPAWSDAREYEELHLVAPVLSPEAIRKREEQQRQRELEAQREQQLIDEELARRGWPKSREGEVRKFLELQKKAAALAPKAGAGAALNAPSSNPSSRDVAGEWLNRSLKAQEGQASESSDEESEEKRKRVATPEAILVCTRPDHAGQFECDTPVDVNLRGGPNNSLAAWRTPQSFVAWAAASCPGARPLPSTTHLVWGCGFGATGNSNSMDRSAGVEVRGRNTYYCLEKETGCRNTQP
jgi:hypothetical protein